MILRTFLLFVLIVNSYSESIGVFDDNVLFDISWPGLLPKSNALEVDSKVEEKTENEDADVAADDFEPLIITTLKNEKYHCIYAPDNSDQISDDGSMTSDADAVVLLTPLFNQRQCLYRVESYWSYELCIGKHLRQYHEEKGAAKTIKMTEYYLGRAGSLQESVQEHTDDNGDEEETKGKVEAQEIPTWHYDGMEYPYFQVEMGGGTPCDLRSNEPRATRLLFICLEDVVAELIYIKEVTTCEYEVVVATNLLCYNKEYKVYQEQAHSIKCYAFDGSPAKPASLLRHQKLLAAASDKRSSVKRQQGSNNKQTEEDKSKNVIFRTFNVPQGPMEQDPQLMKQFLSGDYCITGGTGWWKHELCHERYVKQFHRDANGKTDVILGNWNKERHIKWIEENPKKITDTQVVNYYTGGDICDITKQPRECQVKIKCVKSMTPTQISIYIQEPSTCMYILTVETSFLCPLIENADEHGMLQLND